MLLIRTFGRLASSIASETTAASTSKNQIITIKDSCLNRLKQILVSPQEEFLRVHVETGGCSGFSYMFEIEKQPSYNPAEDLVSEREGYKVVINKDILRFLEGSAIEFDESLIRSSFAITNPIAETKCSCGTSFSVDFNKLRQQK